MASDLFDSMRGKPEKQGYANQLSQGPWATQQPHLQNLFSGAQGLYNQGLFTGAANDPSGLMAQSRGVLSDTISGKYLDPNTNPHLSGAVNDALGLAKSQFTGMYGGPAGQNIGNSGFQEALARNLGQTALPFYMNAYGQERQNQLNATGQSQAFDYAKAQAPWMDISNYMSAIQGNYGGERSGSQEAPWQDQMYQQMFGYGGMPSAARGPVQDFGGMMFSDVRLKENIERVGTHDETGIGLYKFNYLGDDTPTIGVLAQELEQVKPEAVGEVAGFKTVNFKMI